MDEGWKQWQSGHYWEPMVAEAWAVASFHYSALAEGGYRSFEVVPAKQGERCQ